MNEKEMVITQNEKATLERLFLRGIQALGIEPTAENLPQILKAGLDQESAFIQEMLDCKTDRAKKARRVLCAQVYVAAQGRGLAEKIVREFEAEEQHNFFLAARSVIENANIS